jgi:ribosomal protein S12 methylthiotransferase accessory factor
MRRAATRTGQVDVERAELAESQVVAYLGPSMPLADAKRILDADYRPPIRRGDLADVSPGTIIALIDGVFEQNLSVSPREVRDALARGVVIFGGASMGALRAAELPGVIGVGRVFEWYRDEVITRDDEVALLFDQESGRALTVPTVNVRFAVERLCSLGTIDHRTGSSLISAALEIPYKDRVYPAILEAAGMAGRRDSHDLIAMLKAYDLKYRDAQAVLETVDRHIEGRLASAEAPVERRTVGVPLPAEREEQRAAGGEILIWESGDRVTRDELYTFLGFTGKLETFAGTVLGRLALDAGGLEALAGRAVRGDAQAVFKVAADRWGWGSSEEGKVTLADLGLDLRGLDEQCSKEARAGELALELAREGTATFRCALWSQMFLDELALKREVMRLGSLRLFAAAAEESASPAELAEAKRTLCKVNRQYHFSAVRERWTRMGLSEQAAQDAFVEQLARARRYGREVTNAMTGRKGPIEAPTEAGRASFVLGSCRKPVGESRFCLPIAVAVEQARRIGKVIGVTRIGMIGELGDLGGVQIAQAARPGNAWSSSYGSGKSWTRDGAIVGSIMEETEKWAQEQFRPCEPMVAGSYRHLRSEGRFVDPATLDLPYDSVYHDQMPLHWHSCYDLLGQVEVFLPVDPLQMSQRKHDICFTRRGARKHLATNGLGSGFSREEAILHGLCEYVERHAQRLAELFLVNPGGLGDPPYRFVDLRTARDAVQELAERLSRRSATVRVLDITSEIRIPTFVATITRELQRADGYGSHPDPNTAMEMALLEAAQTIASATAGGREDLSIRARSLGRHERPRPISMKDAWFWMDPDPLYRSADEIEGFISADIYEDLKWSLERVRVAGVEQVLVVDLTPPEIEPAHVVRVIVPGLETNNPFFTGPRARLVLLRDLLPKWQ